RAAPARGPGWFPRPRVWDGARARHAQVVGVELLDRPPARSRRLVAPGAGVHTRRDVLRTRRAVADDPGPMEGDRTGRHAAARHDARGGRRRVGGACGINASLKYYV